LAKIKRKRRSKLIKDINRNFSRKCIPVGDFCYKFNSNTGEKILCRFLIINDINNPTCALFYEDDYDGVGKDMIKICTDKVINKYEPYKV
jgi:hypothetical protein